MAQYEIRFWHSTNGVPGTMVRDLASDDAAIAYIRDFVTSGYRNETGANVTLQDQRVFGARNVHGDAYEGFVDA